MHIAMACIYWAWETDTEREREREKEREREGKRRRLSRSLSQADACGQNESSPCRCRVGRKNLICQLISPHNIAKRKAAQLSATLPHGGGIKQIRLNLQHLFPPSIYPVDPTQSTPPTPTPVACCLLPVASCQLDTAAAEHRRIWRRRRRRRRLWQSDIHKP